MNDREKMKKVMLVAAKDAGLSLLADYKNYSRLKIRLKGPRDVVTSADIKSEKIIINKIRQNFPSHRILSEEAGAKSGDSDWLWVIDPLDGTTNFSFHNPIWSVSIGLAHRNKLVMGAIYFPTQDEIFFAEKGMGASLNGRKLIIPSEPDLPLAAYCHGSETKNIKKAIKYYSYRKANSLDCRQMGSAAVELAFVACGRLESLLIPGAKSWDIAAGVLIVREAGGKVRNFRGQEWSLSDGDIIAGSKPTIMAIEKIIKKIKI